MAPGAALWVYWHQEWGQGIRVCQCARWVPCCCCPQPFPEGTWSLQWREGWFSSASPSPMQSSPSWVTCPGGWRLDGYPPPAHLSRLFPECSGTLSGRAPPDVGFPLSTLLGSTRGRLRPSRELHTGQEGLGWVRRQGLEGSVASEGEGAAQKSGVGLGWGSSSPCPCLSLLQPRGSRCLAECVGQVAGLAEMVEQQSGRPARGHVLILTAPLEGHLPGRLLVGGVACLGWSDEESLLGQCGAPWPGQARSPPGHCCCARGCSPWCPLGSWDPQLWSGAPLASFSLGVASWRLCPPGPRPASSSVADPAGAAGHWPWSSGPHCPRCLAHPVRLILASVWWPCWTLGLCRCRASVGGVLAGAFLWPHLLSPQQRAGCAVALGEGVRGPWEQGPLWALVLWSPWCH